MNANLAIRKLRRMSDELSDISRDLYDDDNDRSDSPSTSVKRAANLLEDAVNALEMQSRLAVGELVNAAAHDSKVVGEGNVINGPVPYQQIRERVTI